MCRFELTDDDTYLVNELKGNWKYMGTWIFSYNFNDLAVRWVKEYLTSNTL